MRKKGSQVINRIHAARYLTELESPGSANHPQLNIQVYSFPSRIIGYGIFTVVEIHLAISADRPTHIVEFGGLQVDGTEWYVDWCPQEEKWSPIYRVGPVRYPRNMVLNHRTGRHGVVVPGLPMDGVLLGMSRGSVPIHLRSSELRAELTVADGHREYRSEFPIRFDRTASFVPKHVKRSSLFDGGECPDEYRWILEGKQRDKEKNVDLPSVEDSELPEIDPNPANDSSD